MKPKVKEEEKRIRKAIADVLTTRPELVEIKTVTEEEDRKVVKFRFKRNCYEYIAVIKGMDRPLLYIQI